MDDDMVRWDDLGEEMKQEEADQDAADEVSEEDTDLLRIITSTADKLYSGTNIDDLERHWTPKIGVLSEFFAILVCDAHLVNFRWNYWR